MFEKLEKYLVKLFITACLSLCYHSIAAQVTLDFDQQNYVATSGSKIVLNIRLFNQQSITKNTRFTINTTPFQVIGYIPQKLSIAANDSVIIPLQLYIPRKTEADSSYTITAVISDDNKKVIAQKTVAIQIAVEKKIILQVLQPELFVYKTTDPIDLSVRCNNLGNVGEYVQINMTDVHTRTIHSPITSFFLKGFTDTVIHIHQPIPPTILKKNGNTILLTGNYKDNTVFATAFVNINTVASSKRYINSDNPIDLGMQHSLAIYGRNLGNPIHYYELLANGNTSTGKAAIRYNANLSWYPSLAGGNQLALYNAFIDYQKNKLGVRLGNLYYSDEISISGRGGEISLRAQKNGAIKAGFINSNYNLLDGISGNSNISRPANFVYAGYSGQISTTVLLNTQINQLWDPQLKANSTLGGGSLSFNIAQTRHLLTVGAYTSYSTTKPYTNVNEQSKNIWGAAANLSYTGTYGKWQLLLNNYISSPEYAGIRRGAVNLDERLTYTHFKWNIWGRYYVLQNKPQYLVNFNNSFFPEYSTTIAEAGWGRRINANTLFSIKPYYYKEYNSNILGANINRFNLTAARLQFNLNYNGRHSQMFFFMGDGGYITDAIPVYKNTFACKINASYKFRDLSLSVLLQKGPYYATEMWMYGFAQRPYEQYMITPGYNARLFRNKLSLFISDMITYENTYNRWSNNLAARASLQLPRHYLLDVNFNKQQYGFYQNTQMVDVGIIKRFAAPGSKVSIGSLEALFYEDLNNNNRYDSGEPLARNIMIRLNREIFITDDNGKIHYRAIPNGNYVVSIVQSNGYLAADRPIFVSGKTVVQIPLHKMEAIHGKIVLTKQELSYETDESISGIKINAVDKTGNTYTAITDEQGMFTLYAPANSYTIHIVASSMPDKYECLQPSQNIQLLFNTSIAVNFEVLVKKRQIKVMKFASVD